MSSHSNVSRLDVPDSSSYSAKVRIAHEVADLLKRTRPHLFEQVTELQATITRCQQTLDTLKTRLQESASLAEHEARGVSMTSELSEAYRAAFAELETASQALLDLRHKGHMAK